MIIKHSYNSILIILMIICNACSTLNKNYQKIPIEISDNNQDTLKSGYNIPFKNKIYKNNIKTLRCHINEEPLSLPIINLGSEDKLIISFDDLEGDFKNYFYTIIHCNSNWTKSELIPSDYIEGFYKNPISKYDLSFNTIQKFTHYSFSFPNIDIKPKISGNYVFKIMDENDNILAYKKFMVLEKKVTVQANVSKGTLAKNRKTKHEIDVKIDHPNFKIPDPYSDITIHIKQNNRDDNAIKDLKPLFVKNDELIYDYDDENNFWANNEYRYFDIKSLRYQSERVKYIKSDSMNHVYLFDDFKRSFNNYSILPDINGKFIIDSQEGRDSKIEADYCWVNFNLRSEKIPYGEIYLFGHFSEWDAQKEFKLTYDKKKNSYTTSIYLKQGYYNYHYALKDTTNNSLDVKFIEGTHYQTRNDYFIYVYFKSLGERHERLIGFFKTSSKELF